MPEKNHQNIEPRHANIDTFKAIAAFSVLLIHYCPFPPPIRHPIEVMIRFAVPFFFLINGYFFGSGTKRNGINLQTVNTLKKILLIFMVWWCIYILFPSRGEYSRYGFWGTYEHRFILVSRGIEEFIFFGPTTHLWYFPALICAIITLFLFHKMFRHPIVHWLAAIALYSAGVLGGSYSSTKMGLDLPINARHGPIFSYLPFLVGFQIGSLRQLQKARIHFMILGLFVFGIGFLGHWTEVIWLKNHYEVPQNSHDFVFGTFIMALGAFICSLSESNFFGRDFLAKIGKNSGGIFLIHILILQRIPYLERLLPQNIWIWTSPFIAFALSYYSCLILKRIPLLKNFIPG